MLNNGRKPTHYYLQEIAKFLSGLIAADMIFGLWLGLGRGYISIFLGIPLSYKLIEFWLIADTVLFIILVHYAWHIRLPLRQPKKIFYIILGIIFTLLAAIHLFRIFFPFSVLIDTFVVPVGISVAGFLFASFLAYTSFHFASKKDK